VNVVEISPGNWGTRFSEKGKRSRRFVHKKAKHRVVGRVAK